MRPDRFSGLMATRALDTVFKLGSQLGVDMNSKILKEFWRDLERRFSRKRNSLKD
jgi:hypothetical protein